MLPAFRLVGALFDERQLGELGSGGIMIDLLNLVL